MRIQVIKTFDEAAKIATQWNDLLSCCSASHVPFLRFEYLQAWWKFYGGGEWEQGDLWIITGTNEDGELIGIAPLFAPTNSSVGNRLMLLGSIEISDYLDFIVRSSEMEPFTHALLAFLTDQLPPGVTMLDLYNIPAESPTLRSLKDAAGKLGWTYTDETLQPCPYISLPGDWNAYLASIDKKQRHEIRRKMRRAEESDRDVRWYLASDPATLSQEIDNFIGLMALDPEKSEFLSEKMRLQIRAIIQAAFDAGWLQLAFLTIEGEKAAAYLNFDFAGHIWVYNSGLDPNFRELSPGWVLLGHLLRWANDNQRQAFDFMRGAEDYKYRFGGIDRFVKRVCLEKTQ